MCEVRGGVRACCRPTRATTSGTDGTTDSEVGVVSPSNRGETPPKHLNRKSPTSSCFAFCCLFFSSPPTNLRRYNLSFIKQRVILHLSPPFLLRPFCAFGASCFFWGGVLIPGYFSGFFCWINWWPLLPRCSCARGGLSNKQGSGWSVPLCRVSLLHHHAIIFWSTPDRLSLLPQQHPALSTIFQSSAFSALFCLPRAFPLFMPLHAPPPNFL